MREQARIFIYFSKKSASQKMDGRCRFWKKKNSKPKGYFNECMGRILNFVGADAKLMIFLWNPRILVSLGRVLWTVGTCSGKTMALILNQSCGLPWKSSFLSTGTSSRNTLTPI
ncbi:hypothetical protein K443DRAFT_167428 [Laccaria amethystina LaAM-08-1]|uniref:Uncharacterized protein n=1 Tax=Laccaria amethystina LaAM-08-1 TaxID=1095629 RepID=A0A0C9XRI7_9AGAR|nr:hypothetical protein K443DRAFT_167428 [Laccaria amethystina LaAM-08-1]